MTEPSLTLAALGAPFIPGWDAPGYGLRPFVAELWLIATIVAVLITPFFAKRSNAATGAVSLAGLALALGSLLVVNPAEPALHFRGLLVTDAASVYFKALLLLFTAGVVVLWFATAAQDMHDGDGPEFFTLLLGATLGLSLMGSTTNLLMIFMALEMASLPSYVLAGFRKTHRLGAEAAMKYVLYGAATAAVMAYGLSLLYGLYGTLQFERIAAEMAAVGPSPLAWVAMLCLVVGIGFKIAAVPFHFWCPDVFEGAGIDVAAYLSVASKAAALVLLLRVAMLVGAAHDFRPTPATLALAGTIGVLGALTATWGNLAALAQSNVKRLLAWSSIAHAGYMLCACALVVRPEPAGADVLPARAATHAVLVYLAVYLFMNLGAFAVAGLIRRHTGSEDVRDYAGLVRRSPLLALSMAACLVSLIGLPPLAGFAAKFNLMWTLARNGAWWWVLVAVIAVNTVVSLYYYLRVVKVMYLTESDRPAFFPHPLGLALSLACALLLVGMLLLFSPLTQLTAAYSDLFAVPAIPAQPPPAFTDAR